MVGGSGTPAIAVKGRLRRVTGVPEPVSVSQRTIVCTRPDSLLHVDKYRRAATPKLAVHTQETRASSRFRHQNAQRPRGSPFPAAQTASPDTLLHRGNDIPHTVPITLSGNRCSVPPVGATVSPGALVAPPARHQSERYPRWRKGGVRHLANSFTLIGP